MRFVSHDGGVTVELSDADVRGWLGSMLAPLRVPATAAIKVSLPSGGGWEDTTLIIDVKDHQ